MSDLPEIKPCIFCGSSKVEILPHAGCVRCNHCGASGAKVNHTDPPYLKEIIDKWNSAHLKDHDVEGMFKAIVEADKIFLSLWVRVSGMVMIYRKQGLLGLFTNNDSLVRVTELLVDDAKKYHAIKSKYAKTIPSMFED